MADLGLNDANTSRIRARLQDASYIPTSTAVQGSALPQTYYNGSTLYAAGDATSDRMKSLADRSAQQTQAIQGIVGQRVAVAQAQKNAKAAALAQKKADAAAAAAKAKYKFTPPTTGVPKGWLPGKNGKDVPSSDLYAGGVTNVGGGIKVVGNKSNTSGAANALGGNTGSGSYKYVYNTKLSQGRNKVLATATNYLGTRYVLGGESHSGIDCSGLVQLVYQQMGFKVPTHSAADQGQTGGRNNGNGIPGVKVAWGSPSLQPGDIVAWKDGSHIAIYAGNGKIIEATQTASGVSRGTVLRNLWASPGDVVGIHVTLPGDAGYGGTDARKAPVVKKPAPLKQTAKPTPKPAFFR